VKAVVQKVSSASVSVEGNQCGTINRGLLVLLGITHDDNPDTVRWMANKLANLRIFPDEEGKMNKSVLDISNGGILVISNFTLYGEISSGFRPSFTKAARPEIAEPLYELMLGELKSNFNLNIQSGIFGAMMDVQLINDGPVTIIIEK
jgi:D-aminoacyl-tRNA deacylase